MHNLNEKGRAITALPFCILFHAYILPYANQLQIGSKNLDEIKGCVYGDVRVMGTVKRSRFI
jgi:hypothetical protein